MYTLLYTISCNSSIAFMQKNAFYLFFSPRDGIFMHFDNANYKSVKQKTHIKKDIDKTPKI